jgi:hypothetical protein
VVVNLVNLIELRNTQKIVKHTSGYVREDVPRDN